MWIPLGLSTMLGRETSTKRSSSPSSSFLNKAFNPFGAATMPLPISNSLLSRSPRRNTNFSRLNSTGEAIEDNPLEKLVESSLSVQDTKQNSSSNLTNLFSLGNYLNNIGSYQIGSMAHAYGPQRTMSGPASSSSIFKSVEVVPSEIQVKRSSTTEVNMAGNFEAVGLRMAASCSSLPSGLGLLGGNETAPTALNDSQEKPKTLSESLQTPNHQKPSTGETFELTESMNMINSFLSHVRGACEVVSENLRTFNDADVKKPEPCQYLPRTIDTPPSSPVPSPGKGFSDQYNTLVKERLESSPKIYPKKRNDICNYIIKNGTRYCPTHLNMCQSSDSEAEYHQKRAPFSNLSAMASVNVNAQWSSPEKSPRRKSRPSSKKRRRHQQQSANANVHLGARLPTGSQRKRNLSHSSDSSQTPQSFTETCYDLSDASASNGIPSSPPRKHGLAAALFVQPGFNMESEGDADNEVSESPQKSEESKPARMPELSDEWSEDEDEIQKGQSPRLSPIQSNEEWVEDNDEEEDGIAFESSESPRNLQKFSATSRFFRPSMDSESEESDDEEERRNVHRTPHPRKNGSASRLFVPNADSESEDDAAVDRSRPANVTSTCYRILNRVHRDSESVSAGASEHDDEGWDEVDDCKTDAAWEAMCKQPSCGLFASSLTTTSSEPANEESKQTKKEEVELSEESKQAIGRWEAVYGKIVPVESKTTKVCFPEDAEDLSVMYIMLEWSNIDLDVAVERAIIADNMRERDRERQRGGFDADL